MAKRKCTVNKYLPKPRMKRRKTASLVESLFREKMIAISGENEDVVSFSDLTSEFMSIFNSMVKPNLQAFPRRCVASTNSKQRCKISTDCQSTTMYARSLRYGTFTCLYHLKHEWKYNDGFKIDDVHSKLKLSKWYAGTHLSMLSSCLGI